MRPPDAGVSAVHMHSGPEHGQRHLSESPASCEVATGVHAFAQVDDNGPGTGVSFRVPERGPFSGGPDPALRGHAHDCERNDESELVPGASTHARPRSAPNSEHESDVEDLTDPAGPDREELAAHMSGSGPPGDGRDGRVTIDTSSWTRGERRRAYLQAYGAFRRTVRSHPDFVANKDKYLAMVGAKHVDNLTKQHLFQIAGLLGIDINSPAFTLWTSASKQNPSPALPLSRGSASSTGAAAAVMAAAALASAASAGAGSPAAAASSMPLAAPAALGSHRGGYGPRRSGSRPVKKRRVGGHSSGSEEPPEPSFHVPEADKRHQLQPFAYPPAHAQKPAPVLPGPPGAQMAYASYYRDPGHFGYPPPPPPQFWMGGPPQHRVAMAPHAMSYEAAMGPMRGAPMRWGMPEMEYPPLAGPMPPMAPYGGPPHPLGPMPPEWAHHMEPPPAEADDGRMEHAMHPLHDHDREAPPSRQRPTAVPRGGGGAKRGGGGKGGGGQGRASGGRVSSPNSSPDSEILEGAPQGKNPNAPRPVLSAAKQAYLSAYRALRHEIRVHPTFKRSKERYLHGWKDIDKLPKTQLIETAIALGMDLGPYRAFTEASSEHPKRFPTSFDHLSSSSPPGAGGSGARRSRAEPSSGADAGASPGPRKGGRAGGSNGGRGSAEGGQQRVVRVGPAAIEWDAGEGVYRVLLQDRDTILSCFQHATALLCAERVREIAEGCTVIDAERLESLREELELLRAQAEGGARQPGGDWAATHNPSEGDGEGAGQHGRGGPPRSRPRAVKEEDDREAEGEEAGRSSVPWGMEGSDKEGEEGDEEVGEEPPARRPRARPPRPPRESPPPVVIGPDGRILTNPATQFCDLRNALKREIRTHPKIHKHVRYSKDVDRLTKTELLQLAEELGISLEPYGAMTANKRGGGIKRDPAGAAGVRRSQPRAARSSSGAADRDSRSSASASSPSAAAADEEEAPTAGEAGGAAGRRRRSGLRTSEWVGQPTLRDVHATSVSSDGAIVTVYKDAQTYDAVSVRTAPEGGAGDAAAGGEGTVRTFQTGDTVQVQYLDEGELTMGYAVLETLFEHRGQRWALLRWFFQRYECPNRTQAASLKEGELLLSRHQHVTEVADIERKIAVLSAPPPAPRAPDVFFVRAWLEDGSRPEGAPLEIVFPLLHNFADEAE